MPLTRSSVLHYWSSRFGPVPVIGGLPTHSRNSAGKFRATNDLYHDALVNTPRFQPELDRSTSASERRAMMLLEQGRTNSCLWSRDLTNAVWLTAGTTGTTALDRVGLDGSANTASAVIDNDATTTYGRYQNIQVANDSAIHVVRFWVSKDGTASSFPTLEVFLTGGTTTVLHQYHLHKVTGATALVGGIAAQSIRTVDDGAWWIVEIVIRNNTTGNITLRATVYGAGGTVFGTPSAAAIGGVIIGNVQVELNPAASVVPGSSPIITGAAAVTRSADSFYWNFPPVPQAMMGHLRFIEGGTSTFSGGGGGLLGIDTLAGTGGPRLLLNNNGTTGYQIYYQPVAAGASYAAALVTGQFGDTIDLVWVLTPAGAVRLIQSINGGAVTDSGLVAGAALPAAWADTKLQLGQYATIYTGLNKFAECKIVKYADVVAATAQGIMDEIRSFELNQAGDVL